jgi:hypothetical protein
VILENAGGGGAMAAPVARKMIDAHFSRKKITQTQQPVQAQDAASIREMPEP